jgi:hypothetical protein
MLLCLGRLPPCREPLSSNNVLHDIAQRGESASLLRDLLLNSLVAREKEAHGRPKEVLFAILGVVRGKEMVMIFIGKHLCIYHGCTCDGNRFFRVVVIPMYHTHTAYIILLLIHRYRTEMAVYDI